MYNVIVEQPKNNLLICEKKNLIPEIPQIQQGTPNTVIYFASLQLEVDVYLTEERQGECSSLYHPLIKFHFHTQLYKVV